MTVLPIAAEAAAGGAEAVGGRAAAAGAAGGMAPRTPAAGRPTRGPRGKTGAPGSSDASSGFFSKLGKFDASSLPELTLTPPKKLTASDGAGFLGGLLLYVLALNYVRYGKDGVKGWLAAKFLNRPFVPPDTKGGDGKPAKKRHQGKKKHQDNGTRPA